MHVYSVCCLVLHHTIWTAARECAPVVKAGVHFNHGKAMIRSSLIVRHAQIQCLRSVHITQYTGMADNIFIGCLQVHLAHMSLQSLVKLLMAGIVIAATIPGIIYSQSVSPAINATLLAGQVWHYSGWLCRLCMPRHQCTRELASSHTAHVSKALCKHCCRPPNASWSSLELISPQLWHELMVRGFFMLQAVVVAALEENLYGGVHDDEDEHIYPAAFVVLTSLVGFYVVSRLQLNAKVGPAAAWLTKCIYVAKLSVLIIPEVSTAPSSLLRPALWLVAAGQDTEEARAAPQDWVCELLLR